MIDEPKEVLVAVLASIVVPVVGAFDEWRRRRGRVDDEIVRLRREVATLGVAAARDRQRVHDIARDRNDLAQRVQTLEKIVGEHYPAAAGTLPIRPIRRAKAVHATTATAFDIAYPDPKAVP